VASYGGKTAAGASLRRPVARADHACWAIAMIMLHSSNA
jgi:hypothetical protein